VDKEAIVFRAVRFSSTAADESRAIARAYVLLGGGSKKKGKWRVARGIHITFVGCFHVYLSILQSFEEWKFLYWFPGREYLGWYLYKTSLTVLHINKPVIPQIRPSSLSSFILMNPEHQKSYLYLKIDTYLKIHKKYR
jgi:hypothetical protein